MASTFLSIDDHGSYREYRGVAGVNDEDLLIETTDISKYDTFLLSNGAGACKVLVNDGLQELTAPLSIGDLGAVDLNPVLLTAALRQFGWRGKYFKIKILQEGATACTGSVLKCFKI